jgi:hypothetical protein
MSNRVAHVASALLLPPSPSLLPHSQARAASPAGVEKLAPASLSSCSTHRTASPTANLVYTRDGTRLTTLATFNFTCTRSNSRT